MRLCLSILLFLLPACAKTSTPLQTIGSSDLQQLPNGEQFLEKQIRLYDSITCIAKMEVTSKGNGFLEIANLRIKAYDSHDDGAYFQNSMLTIDLPDLDQDGVNDLRLTGTLIHTDDKGNFLNQEKTTTLFRYDPNASQFVPIIIQ